MPIRTARHRTKPRYLSKAYRKYLEAYNWNSLIENFSNSLYTAANRIGFAARFLGRRTGPPKPVPEPKRVPLVPYNRRVLQYPIPKDWPVKPPLLIGGQRRRVEREHEKTKV